MCGEAQFACVGSINSGKVSGRSYVGGIAGHTSLSLVHNSINKGDITADGNYAAGISALSNTGIYAVCQNYGAITGKGTHNAGIVGLSGNNTMLHYCGNHNTINGKTAPVGGLVAEMGDPREWSTANTCDLVIGVLDIATAGFGVVCAVFTRVASGGIKIAISVVDIVIEGVEKIVSTTWYSMGAANLKNIDKVNEIDMSIKEALAYQIASTTDLLATTRSAHRFNDFSVFSASPLNDYSEKVIELSDYLLSNENNNNHFNEKINEVMYSRAEEIADMNKVTESIYAAVGGVCLVATTICSICALVASGGTAAPIVAGALIGAAGGVASIVKATTDYTDNVVILSQCVNTGNIVSENFSDNMVGGLAGRLHDRAWVYDCLNTGSGQSEGGHIVGNMRSDYTIENCLTLGNGWGGYVIESGVIKDIDGVYGYNGFEDIATLDNGLSAEEISDPSSYKGWSIGKADSRWTIPAIGSGNTFPIPNVSEMTK